MRGVCWKGCTKEAPGRWLLPVVAIETCDVPDVDRTWLYLPPGRPIFRPLVTPLIPPINGDVVVDVDSKPPAPTCTGVAVPEPGPEPLPSLTTTPPPTPPSPPNPKPSLPKVEGSHVDGIWKLTSRTDRDKLGRPDSYVLLAYPPKSTGCSSQPRSRSSEFLGDDGANFLRIGTTILPPRGALVILLCGWWCWK